MKNTFLTFFTCLLFFTALAQAPQKFNYQAVVRNNTGVIVANQKISIKTEILANDLSTILYSETHSVTTNAQGLFSIQIGGGTVISGLFSSIDWGNGNRHIRTSVDLLNGTNFQLMGTSQLVSVPYALYSKNLPITRVGNSDSIYFGDRLLLIPGVKVLNPTKDINTGLVAWYPFNGNANDESGNGNNGTVNGATLTTDRFGNGNSAYNFDGNNFTRISIPNSTNLNLTNDFTISSWINGTSFNDQQGTVRMILSKSGDGVGSPNGYIYGIWGPGGITNNQVGSVNFQAQPFNTAATYPSGTSGLININNWYNFIVSYTKSTSTLKYYINNVLVDTKFLDFNIGINSNELWIGSQPSIYSTIKTFNGKIDDIRIYNRALSQEEITYLATNYSADALPTIQIGIQKWTSKNLDVAFYRNGDPIPQVTDAKAWSNLTTGAWCYYNNDSTLGNKYGKLYNWFAVNDPRGLAPQGWHIPSDAEWYTLENTLGGSTIAGGQMKEAGTINWASPNKGGNNNSGWAGLPGGYRNNFGTFTAVSTYGFWWSDSKEGTWAWYRKLSYDYFDLYRKSYVLLSGMSIRCLRD